MGKRLLLTLLMMACTQPLLARVGFTPRNLTDTFVWAGGDVSRTFDFCVESILENNPNGTTVIPYSVTADVNGAAPFTVDSGASSIPVSLAWQDLVLSNSQALSPATTTAEQFTGALRGCPGGNNGRLVLTIAESDLVSASPGTYSQTFKLTVANPGGGRPSARNTVTLNITLPDSIQITQVDNINLGTFDGINDVTGTDDLCVFRKGGGLYGVTITGSGAGGAFMLTTGASMIPFSVTWNDGTGAQAVSPAVLISGLTNTYTVDPYCSGGAASNATLGVQVLANDILNAATAVGTHTGILTITVEMQ